MPPRPRPKPKVRSGNDSQPLKETAPSRDEEDSIFIKSGNLTTATWKQMNQIPSAHESYDDYNSGNDEDPRKTAKKIGGKFLIPEQTKSQLNERVTQALYIDDSEGESALPMQSKSSPMHSKPPRSRSRSITPPPELAPEQERKARNLVRQALGVSNRRSVSPQSTYFDHLKADETEAFDPELASIALRSAKGSGLLPSGTREDDGPHDVIINVQWRYHPSERGQKTLKWTFSINRSENLRRVFKEVADATKVLPDDIVLALKGHKVYASVSPAALGIWSDGEFDACLVSTYELLKDSRLGSPSGSRTTTAGGEESGEGSSDTDSIGYVTGDTLKLTLRSARTPKGVVLTVRPQTKCGAILKAYLRKAGLANEYLEHDTGARSRNRGRRSVIIASGPRLVVDGDKLDNEVEIGEMDVEDGDIIEVTGL